MGRFPRMPGHPDVLLHFSNDADATSQQTHYVKGAGTFSFAIPGHVFEDVLVRHQRGRYFHAEDHDDVRGLRWTSST